MRIRLAVTIMLLALTGAGCGGGQTSSDSTSDPISAYPNNESSATKHRAEAAMKRTFAAFANAAREGKGTAACDQMTTRAQSEWAETRAEQLNGGEPVPPGPSSAPTDCPLSVLRTHFATHRYELDEFEINENHLSDAEMLRSEDGEWVRQGPISFVKQLGRWLIAGGRIRG